MLVLLIQGKDWKWHYDKEYENSGLTYENPISCEIAVELH